MIFELGRELISLGYIIVHIFRKLFCTYYYMDQYGYGTCKKTGKRCRAIECPKRLPEPAEGDNHA